MERKTTVAADGGQEIVITRDFDLPLDLLFRAHADPEIVAQWMGTAVLKLESKKHGSYALETRDGNGGVVFSASGVIHEFRPNEKITRTFEMDQAPLGVQLEFYTFERLTNETSRLQMRVLYESSGHRDQVLRLPFVQGINIAHDRLQAVANGVKSSNNHQ